ncbi:MAG: TetR/AcrR family transcriptional regulator [Eubacteriaceae bacterium]
MVNKITTKNKIVLASKRVFKLHGYKRATMSQIAKEAGINLSLFNYYFPRKQDIIIEVMGAFLNSIYYFALLHSSNNPIVAYFATNYVYNDRLLNNPSNLRFYIDVMNREDKNDLNSYTNFNKVYISIIEFLNINTTYEELKYKDVYIFGAKKELTNVYLDKIYDISFSELVDTIAENTCRILDISDYIINDSRKKSIEVINKLNDINFKLL